MMKHFIELAMVLLLVPIPYCFAEPSGTTAGNGNEYQIFTCPGCVSINPKLSPEKEKEAESMREKMVESWSKGDLEQAEEIAKQGLSKGYVLFYAELASIAYDRARMSGQKIKYSDSKEREWFEKGAEKGSNNALRGLFTDYCTEYYDLTSDRADLLEAYFWGYIGIASGEIRQKESDWIQISKDIKPEEKSATIQRANEWMKTHNWPAITQ